MDKSELANAHARWNAALEHLGVLLEQRCADPRPTPPHLKAELRRRLASLQSVSADLDEKVRVALLIGLRGPSAQEEAGTDPAASCPDNWSTTGEAPSSPTRFLGADRRIYRPNGYNMSERPGAKRP